VFDVAFDPQVPNFPNPVPSEIHVPHWALLDVTVRCQFFLCPTVITMQPRARTIGTPTYRMPPVVSVVSPVSPCYGLTPPFSIDTPEVLPGSLIGPSSVSTTATSSLHPSSTGSSTPTPLPTSKSSNVGAIAGGAVAGVAVIIVVIAAIFYLRRRRRSQVRSAMSAGVGVSQSQQPLSGKVVPPSSSGLPISTKLYVRDVVSRVAVVCPHASCVTSFLFLYT
jgi:hypothetical protein